jgi:hypothetical protein
MERQFIKLNWYKDYDLRNYHIYYDPATVIYHDLSSSCSSSSSSCSSCSSKLDILPVLYDEVRVELMHCLDTQTPLRPEAYASPTLHFPLSREWIRRYLLGEVVSNAEQEFLRNEDYKQRRNEAMGRKKKPIIEEVKEKSRAEPPQNGNSALSARLNKVMDMVLELYTELQSSVEKLERLTDMIVNTIEEISE